MRERRTTISKFSSLALCVGLGLLSTYSRTAKSDPAPAAQKAKDHTAEDERIRKAVDKIVSVEFLDTPIKEFADDIEGKGGFQVEIDSDILSDAVLVDPNPIVVTLELRRVPLRRVLREALGPLKLSYIIAEGVLLITTVEKATEVS